MVRWGCLPGGCPALHREVGEALPQPRQRRVLFRIGLDQWRGGWQSGWGDGVPRAGNFEKVPLEVFLLGEALYQRLALRVPPPTHTVSEGFLGWVRWVWTSGRSSMGFCRTTKPASRR